MAKNCNKKSHRKDRAVAEATTRRNKIAKLRKQVAKNPTDLSARNALVQACYDAGQPNPFR